MDDLKKVAIVTTSIGDEAVFRRFFKEYSKIDNSYLKVKLFITGDLNSPQIEFSKLEEFKEFINKGFEFEYIDTKIQAKIMRSKNYLEDLIPWKRIQRRNISYFFAYIQNFDYIITVDDDNFPVTSDFIKMHIANLEQKTNLSIINLSGGSDWFNPCHFLGTCSGKVIHRGFPLKHRYSGGEVSLQNDVSTVNRVIVSEGFWLGDPDIDALSRLEGNPISTKIQNISTKNFSVPYNLIAPFNSQNTAFIREIIPAVFLSSKIGRYDDIWASYFLKALVYVKEDLITYGHPLVVQDRNDHDIIKDLENEIFGMKNTEEFVIELFNLIREQKNNLKGLNYFNLTKKVAELMLLKTKKFGFYYLDLLRWIDFLSTFSNK